MSWMNGGRWMRCINLEDEQCNLWHGDLVELDELGCNDDGFCEHERVCCHYKDEYGRIDNKSG